MITIKANSKVLFQGDSVTDCYRDRNDELSLGNSYVKDVAKYLNKFNIKTVNKAIAGNKVNDLINRFDNDFKNIKPDYIFILIGVNDTWHNYPNQKQTTVFEEEYDYLLSKIKQEINVPVIILEPFIIGYNKEITCMKNDLNNKIDSIKKLSKKYNYLYLSFENDFNNILTEENYLDYTIEGIHLLEKGYEIISNKIISSINIAN